MLGFTDTSQAGRVLEKISRALMVELHILTEFPDLLYQQLFNRLQWDDDFENGFKTIERQVAGASSPRKMLRLDTPYRESKALVRILAGHEYFISACAFSPDGALLASAEEFGPLRIWETRTGQLLNKINTQARQCAFSPDGRLVYSLSPVKVPEKLYELMLLQSWDVYSGLLVKTFQPATLYSFSPDGARIMLEGLEDSHPVWETIRKVRERSKITEPIGCSLSPDGKFILLASHASLQVLDLSTGLMVLELKGHEDYVFSTAFSPDGKRMVSAGRDGTLRIWEYPGGALLHVLKGRQHNTPVFSFTPDGQYLVSADERGSLRVWEPQTGRQLGINEGLTDDFSACASSPDGKHLLTGGHDRTLRIWDIPALVSDERFEGHTSRVSECLFSPDGGSLISSSWDFTLRIWKINPFHALCVLSDPLAGLQGRCSFSPDGQYFASCGETVRIWEAPGGTLRKELSGHLPGFNCCRFSPDGKFMLASSEKEKILVVWDLASGRRIASRGTHREAINSFAISPDGKHIASASNDGTLNVLDARSGDLLRVLEGHASSVQACAFSPDGSLLVSAGWDKTLRVWEVVDGTLKFIITGHTDHVQACSFSPDGKFIVSAGTDMTVRVWRAPSGERELIFPFTNPVEAIGMHPFLPRIVCGDIAGRLIILTMQGIAYDRVVVTAVAGTPGLEITCPACRQRMLVEADKLGSVVTCQSAGCSLQLEINQQVIRPDQAIYFQSYGLREVTPGSRVRNITGPPRSMKKN